MFRPVRALISLSVVAIALWGAFAIDLGGKTFAEHVDTISETPEAQELLAGTRSAINPALEELRDRVLGEYVEAPTWIPDEEVVVPAATRPVEAEDAEHAEPAVESDYEPPLPGARRRGPRRPAALESEADAPAPKRPKRVRPPEPKPEPKPRSEPKPEPKPAPVEPKVDPAPKPEPTYPPPTPGSREAGPSEPVYH
ncbi:hypothetical protein PPSIR1_31878 [Plesiocystis pacifica SIR-1]|uniref:Uncharacterized protein n=1 Tax=Plesiocystis pacifica SIR-1 TaxID=391625 RepID=A6G2U3_9BACT|nr:hypothetical protein [Plesiocystis pacifica]EDM79793.1 hypothetical protein PPSIR1_31878 [Plesiocystis pacifica SIR-1]